MNLTSEREHELAEALERYINPHDPEFDPDFTRQIFAIRPDWFNDEERARVAPWLVVH